jgi:hypothetical protein
MPEERMLKRVYKWTPMLTRPLEKPKNRWENDIKKLKIKNWTRCIQDCNKWKLYVEKAKAFKERRKRRRSSCDKVSQSSSLSYREGFGNTAMKSTNPILRTGRQLILLKASKHT